MVMPGMSGTQVMKMLREIKPYVRIILSSGYIPQGELMKEVEFQCSGFLQKPYSFVDLSMIVHNTITAS